MAKPKASAIPTVAQNISSNVSKMGVMAGISFESASSSILQVILSIFKIISAILMYHPYYVGPLAIYCSYSRLFTYSIANSPSTSI